MTDAVYDVVVVGGGPSGSASAKELTSRGLRVLMLEAGPEIRPADFDPARKGGSSDINLLQRARATLRGQAMQARAAFFNDRLAHMFVNDSKNPYTTPPDAPFVWIRGRQAGGRSHVFGRMLLRWSDDDFRFATRRGTGVDWPLSYAELEPFYGEVERDLALYGRADGLPTLPDSLYAGQAEFNFAEEIFKDRVESRWPQRKVTTWRYMKPDPTRVLKPMRDALATGRLDIRYHTIARRLLVDPRTGKATGVEVIDANSYQLGEVRARAVVLCASTIESVRLLLNSASERHPHGVGGASGHLGRYFMDQLPCLAVGNFLPAKGWATADPDPVDPFYGPTGGIFIPREVGPDGVTAATDFDFQGGVGRYPQRADAAARVLFFGFGLMRPDRDNRITLHPRRTDAWGIPVPHLRCKPGEADLATLHAQVEALTATIEQTGGELEFIGSPLGLIEKGRGAYPDSDPVSRFMFRTMFPRSMVMGAAIHETGGARMGASQDVSVLNGFNQCWDAPNVVVTDASAFCTSGTTGTTLTIMALSIRACRELANRLSANAI